MASGYIVSIDELLAAAIRGETTSSNPLLGVAVCSDAILDRISYHGVVGLLRELPAVMTGWPGAVTKRVIDGALAQAMWELRHRQILNELLAALAAENVVAILLKGTALAYDIYPVPATRARGDSDLLVDPANLAESRRVLERLGFKRASDIGEPGGLFSLQEAWSRTCNSAIAHHIDLHWQTLNSPALVGVLPVAECADNCIALPRLGPDAMAVDRVRTLIHTCIHRMLSFTSPYFVGGRTYYGGDRLIWLNDIDLLARALSDHEWDSFVHLAIGKGVAEACLDGLLRAQQILATPVPIAVRNSLAVASPASCPAAYLRARQLGRAWQDLRAIPGLRQKYGYFLSRTLPTAEFVRDKYPQQKGLPLPLLYARRLFDLFRARPTQSPEQ